MKYKRINKLLGYRPKLYISFKNSQKITNENGEAEYLPNEEYIYIEKSQSNIKKGIKFPIGTLLITLMNNYKNIINSFKNIVINGKEFEHIDTKFFYNDYYQYNKFLDYIEKEFDFLDKLLVELLIPYIDYFIFEIFRKCISKEKELNFVLNAKDCNPFYYNNYLEVEKISDMELKDKYKYSKTINFRKDIATKYLDKIINELDSQRRILENSFVPTKKDSKTNIFTGIDLSLPIPKIEYTSKYSKHPIPYKYTYVLNTFTDFFYASIYHICLDKKVIKKCKGCNKYFIPSRTNQVYCNKDYFYKYYNENTSCKEIFNAEKRRKREMTTTRSLQFYRTLRKRIFKKYKGVYNSKYESERLNFDKDYDYETKENEFKQLYNNDMKKVEETLLKLYTTLDKELQNKGKQTRPTETKKYWVE